jgi:hypothetical protein
MKKFLWLAMVGGLVVGAAEQTTTVSPQRGGSTTPVEHQKDPQQRRNEPTTQIRPGNTPAGSAATREAGTSSVDKDIQQRVLVSLSTGTVGTQGILASNQLTDIKVTVTNRQVTLRGDVMSEKSKQTIGKRVAGLDGVKGVSNELTVNPRRKASNAELMRPDGYSPGTGKK